MNYILVFSTAFLLAALFTPVVRLIALKYNIVDRPDGGRKIHKEAIPYLGGVGIFLAFIITVSVNIPFSRQLMALLLGCLILVIVGVYDDIKGLSPWIKLGCQFIAASVALAGGIGITSINNPLGGVIILNDWKYAIDLFGLHFHIAPIANLVSLLWMVGLANTINFLDGLDGLACGVSGIAALIVFSLSIGPKLNQPGVAILAIILAGAAFGFLPYNFNPARIFIGDSGALFLGLTLAMLAIYSGAKLATITLVLGFPILDAMWAVLRRLWRRKSPFKADRGHLHHLLLGAGLTQRQAVLILYLLSATFGLIALFSGSFAKLLALLVLALIMIMGICILLFIAFRKDSSRSTN